MSGETTYRCGCTNALDEASGLVRRVHQCRRHRRQSVPPADWSSGSYVSMGTMIDHTPQCRRYIAQLLEPLQSLGISIPRASSPESVALEIGSGCSMYAPLLLRLGYKFTALEPSHWAANWTATTFDCEVHCRLFDSLAGLPPCELILSAHAVEHMPDAPAALRMMFDLLLPGGLLLLVLPDDLDPLNPDHLWFFNEVSLRGVLEQIGFERVEIVSRRIVEHENFMYCAAWKPAGGGAA